LGDRPSATYAQLIEISREQMRAVAETREIGEPG
jgi:hypothetical protein